MVLLFFPLPGPWSALLMGDFVHVFLPAKSPPRRKISGEGSLCHKWSAQSSHRPAVMMAME